MKKILVTGGAGYIGSHMVRVLLDGGLRAVVFDNLSTGYRVSVPKGVPFVKGDLRKPADISRALTRHNVDAVMHFAGSIVVPESVSAPMKYYENNVIASINLLNAMRAHKVRKFIFSSTAAVYGDPKRVPIKEEDATVPVNPYGRTKLMVEQILSDLADTGEIAYIALRYFNACGAHPGGEIGESHKPETHLIPNILKAAKGELKALTMYGTDYPTVDGTCVRDYIHVMDLCRAHLLALKALNKGLKRGIFNLGNGRGHSVQQVVDMVEQVTGRQVRVHRAPRRPGDQPKLIASPAKAKKILGWTPQHPLKDIIQSAWAWEKNK